MAAYCLENMQNLDTKHNILVIEDNATVSRLIYKILSKNKLYEIQVTDKIKWAKQALRKTYFDLICLDILLPDGNGLSLCKELREDEAYKNTKILIISQKKEVLNKIDAFEIGADEYLSKPFHPHELEIRVKKHLGLINSAKSRIEYKNLSLDIKNMTFLYEKYELPLTKTEFLFLRYLFEHEGYANLEILARFLSSKKFTTVNNKAVIVCVNRLRKKLRVNTGNPFIKTKYGTGYYIP